MTPFGPASLEPDAVIVLNAKIRTLVFAALLLVQLPLFGQGLATFAGRVVDDGGTPIAQADIRIEFLDGRIVGVTTDEEGAFSVGVDGRFELEVSGAGFRTLRTTTIALASDAIYGIDIILLDGDPSDVELVELLIEEPAEFGKAAGPSVREDLPRSDRLFGLRGGLNVSGIAEGSSQQWIAASGNVFASSSSVGVLLDPSEFSAELPTNLGIDDSLSSGGPNFNGNAYYFHRNDALNAKNFFDAPNQPIPPFKYHFFGVEAGGQPWQGTFLFARYWGLRIRQSITRAATVPKPAWVNGDFSDLTNPVLDPETGFPFPGNIIPAERLNPTGVGIAAQYPLPNILGADIQNFRSVGELKTVADAFGARIDHRMTVSDETSFEYQYSRDTTDDPFNLVTGTTNLPGFGVRDALDTQTIRLQNTHVFTPRFLHQLRFSFGYLHQPRRLQVAEGVPSVIVTDFSGLGHATNIPQERKNRTYELFMDLSWLRGSRDTKIGGSFRYFNFEASMALLDRGQFQFTGGSFSRNALGNLLLGLPANALRMEGKTERTFQNWTSGLYIQHDWRISPMVRLSAGLRWDYQTPFSESSGRISNFRGGDLETSPERLYSPDFNNWGPRLGVVWTPLQNNVIRAGYGIFYDNLAVGDSLFLLALNPPFVRFTVENNDPVVPRFDLDTVFADTSTATPLSIFSAASSLANPYVQHWNVTFERFLWAGYEARFAYAGQKGTRLRRQINLNQPEAGLAGTVDDRRPYPAYRNIFQFETSASSSTHALDFGIIRRFMRGVGFRADYRLSKSIDDATLISILPQNSHDLAAERGLSDFHVQNRLLLSGSYNFPRSGGWLGSVMKGWQVQGVGVFQSGTPLSAILGTDVAGTGSPIVNRPHLVGDPHLDDPSPTRFFNTDAFVVPEFGTFGNSGRNVITGPGLANVDLALTRVFRVSDLLRAQFRADFYNAFNRPNFVAPPTMQNFVDSPDFGALFVARAPRILQMGLRLFW